MNLSPGLYNSLFLMNISGFIFTKSLFQEMQSQGIRKLRESLHNAITFALRRLLQLGAKEPSLPR